MQINRTQFQQIQTRFAKLKSELNRDKLAEFQDNLKFFIEYAPFTANSDIVTRQELSELQGEVSKALRATLINTNETQNYRQFQADAKAGISRQPDCQSHVYSEMMAQLRTNPEMRDLANRLGGCVKADFKKELPA